MEVGTDCTLFSHGDAELRLANGTGAVYVATIDGNRGCIDNLIINGNKDNNVGSNGVGSQSSAHYGSIKNCEIKECDNYSIHTYKSDFFEITNNYIHDGDVYGIALYGEAGNYCISNLIDGNRIDDVRHAIKLVYTDACTVSNNQIKGNSPTGVGIRSEHVDGPTRQITIIGNTLRDGVASGASYGIYFDNDASALSSAVTIMGNTIEDYYYGIYVGYDYNTITGNILVDSRYAGIYVAATGDYVHVEGNYFDEDGIHTYGDNGVFQDNYIIGGTANSPAGIYIRDGDNNYLDGNTIRDVTGDGIEVLAAATNTRITHTNRIDNCTNILVDGSASTIFDSIKGEFNQYGGGSTGRVAPVINTSPGGIDIDANDEFVDARIPLGDALQQVMRIKIWAYSNVIEATNNMLLRIVAHGATSGELWSGNAVDVVNHPSEETGGIVQYDVIHWIIDVGDDAQIGTLAAGDFMELMAVGEAAGAPDIATDALFGGYEIEYI
jgi:parallel beta-helix repeat protein